MKEQSSRISNFISNILNYDNTVVVQTIHGFIAFLYWLSFMGTSWSFSCFKSCHCVLFLVYIDRMRYSSKQYNSFLSSFLKFDWCWHCFVLIAIYLGCLTGQKITNSGARRQFVSGGFCLECVWEGRQTRSCWARWFVWFIDFSFSNVIWLLTLVFL